MADNNEQQQPDNEAADQNTSIFDLFEPPPERDPNSFGKIPVIKEDEIDLTDSGASPEVKAAADAEAAGLQHWTAPPTGQVPAILSSDKDESGLWADVKGPSWHGDDPSWAGPDLADVFADTESVSIEAQPEHYDDPDDDEDDYTDDFDAVAVPRPARPAAPPTTPPTESPAPPTASDEPDPSMAPPQPRQRPAVEQRVPSQARPPTAQPPVERTAPPAAPVPTAGMAGQRPQSRHEAPAPDPVAGPPSGPAPPQVRPQPGPAPTAQPPADGTTDIAPPRSQRTLSGALAEAREAVTTPPGRPGVNQLEPNIDDIEFVDNDYVDQEYYEDEVDEDYGLGPVGGRNIPQAIGVGVALAAVVLAAMWFGPYPTLMVVVVLALLAVLELYNAMRMAGLRPATLLGIVGTVAAPAAAYYRGDAAFPLIVALAVVFGTLWYLVGADTERPVLNLSLTMMGIFWVGGLAAFAALMLRQDGGIELLLATIIITVASDTMAYIGGRAYGSRPFHHASPNKTWEGTITGLLGSVFAGFAIGVTDMGTIWDGNLIPAIVLGAVVGCLAPMGDLAESVVKRDLGVKDMGTLLPGHGGVLDRVDGLLFALPGAYYLALIYGLI